MLGRVKAAPWVPIAAGCIFLIVIYITTFPQHLSQDLSSNLSEAPLCEALSASSFAFAVAESIETVNCVLTETNEQTAQAIRTLGVWEKPKVTFLQAWLMPEAAPEEIPPILKDEFTMGGKAEVIKYYFNQAYLGGAALESVWTIEMIDDYRRQVRARHNYFNYDNEPLYKGLDVHAAALIAGKRGLVVGSEKPWAEAMLLEYGAANLTTLEFGAITSHHPSIDTYTPSKFTEDFLTGKIPQYDFGFTYSSIEHDGLGRYGDVLNPNGDFQIMARLLKLVRPGGALFLGIPCCVDRLYWNAHRQYGPIRLPMLLAGWHVVGLYQSSHSPMTIGLDMADPLWVLQNKHGCAINQTNTNVK